MIDLILKYCLFYFILFSCSPLKIKQTFKKKESRYELKDKSGTFVLKRSSGLIGNKFIVREKLLGLYENEKKPFEKKISISKIGKLKNVNILRPEKSSYAVWFDKKKYSTQMKINPLKRAMEVVLKSPESRWNGKRLIPFPRGTGVFCYFSQLIECITYTGFINKAIEKKVGVMNFHIVWDGYPFVHEQYLNLKKELFSRAEFIYDQRKKDSHDRFILKVSGQSIFYLLKDGELVKKFWVSQGYTLNRVK